MSVPPAAELDVVREDERVLAFHHTRPYWRTDLVVVPRRHLAPSTFLG